MDSMFTLTAEDTVSAGGRTIDVFAMLSGAWGGVPRAVSPHVPPAVSLEEAYYWTAAWQRGEQAALEDLEAGRSHTFDDPDDALRWLFAEE